MIEVDLVDGGIEDLLLGQEFLQFLTLRLRRILLRRPEEWYDHRREREQDQQGADQVFHAITAPIP